jgi:hypothetical protein
MEKVTGDRLEITDFALGVLNAASEQSPGLILNCRDRLVDSAFEDAAGYLLHLIDKGEVEDMDVRFRIATHPIHGDSENVFKTMSFLAYIGHVERINRSSFYQFNRGEYASAEIFHRGKRIPGQFDTYRKLAGRFIAIVNGQEVEPIN